VLLAFVLRDIAWQETVAALRQLQAWHLLALVAMNFLVLSTLYSRWRFILLAQGHDIPFWELTKISVAGFAVSYLTPGPQFGGEPVQVYLLHRHHQVPLTTATASVALDKMLNVLTSFSYLFFGILVVSQGHLFDTVVKERALVIALIFFTIPIALLTSWFRGARPFTWLLSHAQKLSSHFGRWHELIGRVEAEIVTFCHEHPWGFAMALTLSLLSWFAMAAEYWLMAYFLGLRMTTWQAITLFTATRLAFLMPFPGAVGTLEAAQVWALGAMGFEPALGISLSLLIRMRDLSLALLGLWWSGVRLLNRPLDS
jgi:uncharacterized protein (TIRG00374 family)